MAQLRSDILCKRKREEIEISERQYKRLHIAEPIQEYESDNEKNDIMNLHLMLLMIVILKN
jgi:hypothetical protein